MTFEEWYEGHTGEEPLKDGGDEESFFVQQAMRIAYDAGYGAAVECLYDVEVIE